MRTLTPFALGVALVIALPAWSSAQRPGKPVIDDEPVIRRGNPSAAPKAAPAPVTSADAPAGQPTDAQAPVAAPAVAQPARPLLRADPTEPTEPPDSGPTVRTPTGSAVYPPGKYRISISGFTVNHQTDDDFFQLDGKGDEVYLSVQVLKSNPSWITSKLMESPVIGDKNGFPSRIAAGSASPLGGLRTGDQVRLPTPFVVWEGALSEGLLVTPTIWEWDGTSLDQQRIELGWKALMRPPHGKILSQFGPYSGPSSFGSYPTIRAAGYQELVQGPCYWCFINEYTNRPSCGLFCGNPLDGVNRPIGVNMSSGFRPGAVRIGYQNLEAVLAGKNVTEFPIQYQDNKKGSGDYTISLRLERIM